MRNRLAHSNSLEKFHTVFLFKEDKPEYKRKIDRKFSHLLFGKKRMHVPLHSLLASRLASTAAIYFFRGKVEIKIMMTQRRSSMNRKTIKSFPKLLAALELDEEPMGIFFTDTKPADGFSPKPMDLPTREKEIKNEIDWQGVFSQFSCVMGNIWRARKKKTAAFFSAEQFGCAGGAFWLGFLKPQTETIIHYVSTGIPGRMEGEFYCDSPGNLKQLFDYVNPEPAPFNFCVFKPLSRFAEEENPEFVTFFVRPEVLSGLHQLATFTTNNPEVVASPWSAACGSLVAWPLYYRAKGLHKAVIGGWDPSARKFFKTDELSFTVPFSMFAEMSNRFGESFLKTKTWANVKKKITRSKKAWKEIP
jgi:uncharacterized protein (DUF169 family)